MGKNAERWRELARRKRIEADAILLEAKGHAAHLRQEAAGLEAKAAKEDPDAA